MLLAPSRAASLLLVVGLGLPAGLPLIGCHLGVPPASVGAAVHIASLDVAAAEPALADDLRQGLTDAFAARGLHAGPTALALRVVEASAASAAASDRTRVHRVRLAVELRLLGPDPRVVVLRGERGYEVDPADGLAAAAARATAFRTLSTQLADDAALWLAHAPDDAGPAPSSPPGSHP